MHSRQKSIQTLSYGRDVLGPSHRLNAKVLVVRVETVSFETKHIAAATNPTKMRRTELCPKERTGRGNKCRWQQSISLNGLPKKSFVMAAIRAKQGSTHTRIDVCVYILLCVYLKEVSSFYALCSTTLSKRGLKYKLIGLLKRWIYECIPNKTHAGKL